MPNHSVLGRVISTLLRLVFVLTVVSFWFRNDFADTEERSAALRQMGLAMEEGVPAEPRQQAIKSSPFDTERNGFRYTVSPLYDYTLQGVVVTLRAHDANYGLHKRWGDHLNIADVCVVWGHNAAYFDLNRLKFRSEQFTCYVSLSGFGNSAERLQLWEQFRHDQLSNNHLLVDDETVREQVSKMEIGDVITVRGQLATYGNGNGPPRGTSTIRNDSGNGACETIYVNDITIVGNVRTFWYPLFWYSLWSTLLLLVVWLFGVGWGHF